MKPFSFSTVCCILLVQSLFPLALQRLDAGIVDLEEQVLDANSFFNGGPDTNTDGWFSESGSTGDIHFGNSFNSAFGGFWNGFSYSNVVDTTTPGFINQYAAFPGSGSGGSANYAVGFSGSHSFINLNPNQQVQSLDLTNTTYAALSILNGDQFAKQFGGESGNDPDFFSVVFTGYTLADGLGDATGTAEFFLADYRFDDNSLDFVVDTWETISLASLGTVRSIGITYRSSDVGQFGINTPTYVALDNLLIASVPEPNSILITSAMLIACLVRQRRSP